MEADNQMTVIYCLPVVTILMEEKLHQSSILIVFEFPKHLHRDNLYKREVHT